MDVQRCICIYQHEAQQELLSHLENDQNHFWKSIGKTVTLFLRNKQISMQVVLEDGSICNDVKVVLRQWQDDFCSLLNVKSDINIDEDCSIFVLHRIFNVCFQTGQIPLLWSMSIIKPKSGAKDPKVLQQYFFSSNNVQTIHTYSN